LDLPKNKVKNRFTGKEASTGTENVKTAENGFFTNELVVELESLLTLPTEKVFNDQETNIKSGWRVERRNDRTPTGYAIYQRGKPVYIGYVGFNSPPKPDFPTYSQLVSKSSPGTREDH
jgi:hypothetical protein